MGIWGSALVRFLSTGAGRIVFVNAHGGNVPSLALVIPQLIAEGHNVAWVPCSVSGGDLHAGRTETSMMLHLMPDLVDIGLVTPGNTSPLHQLLLPTMRERGTRAVSPSVVLGDPAGANAAEGVAEMVGDVVEWMRAAPVDQHGCLRPARMSGAAANGKAS